jgi:hypothetical protein
VDGVRVILDAHEPDSKLVVAKGKVSYQKTENPGQNMIENPDQSLTEIPGQNMTSSLGQNMTDYLGQELAENPGQNESSGACGGVDSCSDWDQSNGG